MAPALPLFTSYLSESLDELEASWRLEPERLLHIRQAIQRDIDAAEEVIADAGGGTAGLMRILQGEAGDLAKMALDFHLDRAERMLAAARKEPHARAGELLVKGRQAGGSKSARSRQGATESRDRRIVAEAEALLREGRNSRDLASLLAGRHDLSTSQVRRILSKKSRMN